MFATGLKPHEVNTHDFYESHLDSNTWATNPSLGNLPRVVDENKLFRKSPAQRLLESQRRKQMIKIKTKEESIDWPVRLRTLCTQNKIDDALSLISTTTTYVKETGQYAQLSEDLNKIQLHKLPTIILSALLRNTFSIREHISSYDEMFNKINSILNERHAKIVDALRGFKPY